MAISTFSTFYYGFEITDLNKYFNFDEGGGELTAEIQIGAYTLTEMLVALKTAMDAAGANTYSPSIDRATRLVTIASTGNYSILLNTGTQKGSSPYSLLGFTSGVDTTSALTYTGISQAGSEYTPQFWLQDFVDQNDYREKIDSKVNESANGTIEVFNFGTRKFTQMSFKFITDMAQDGHVIRNNPSGVSDCRAFLQEITTKNPVEFMVNLDDRNTYLKLVLGSTPSSSEGTGYKLIELVKNNLPNYYEINNLKFRVFA